jgi:hypothetical protein
MLRILSLKMPERVNCNILQPSTLARRAFIITTERRSPRDSRKTKDTPPAGHRAGKYKDASFTVNVSRKWRSAKNAVRGIFDVYKWLDTAPLGLFIDAWA